jgi:hypothetical protein
MNAPINGADAEPWSYAESRLRTCGRVIALAPDKLAVLSDLASGFARDVQDGFLTQPVVADRLHELSDAYGLIAEFGTDTVQRVIADGLQRATAPVGEAWRPPVARKLAGTTGGVTIATAAALRTKEFPPIKYIVPRLHAGGLHDPRGEAEDRQVVADAGRWPRSREWR